MAAAPATQNKMEAAVAAIEGKEITVADAIPAGFGTGAGFDLLLRQANWLSQCDMVPKQFQKNIANCVIALEISNRMEASPLAVMQNLYIVHGKPGWSSQFIVACVNSTGKFSPIRFEMTGSNDTRQCVAWATEKATGERLESPPMSIAIAKAEGWFGKDGSKWKTMPELMLRYRAATLFGRLYAPEMLMGMKTTEEIVDMEESDGGVYELKTAQTVAANANKETIDIQPEPAGGGEMTDAEKAEIIAAEAATVQEGPDF